MNNSAEQLADRYIALWNEPNPDVRRESIEQLWTGDAVHLVEPPEEIAKRAAQIGVTATLESRGHEALVARVTRAYDEFVGTGQYEFRRHGEVAALRDLVKLRWAMVPVGGGDTVAIGIDLLLLTPAGRIHTDYQLLEP
ncbi:hypothetical protein [Kribbella sp. NPDC055071]